MCDELNLKDALVTALATVYAMQPFLCVKALSIDASDVADWRALRYATRALRADRELMVMAVEKSNGVLDSTT